VETGDIPRADEGLIRAVDGRRPTVHATAWVAPAASVTGSVRLEPRASIWYGASVRGDLDTIEIGRETNVQDCSALHVDAGFPLRLGDLVSVGHGAVLHGCTVGDRVLVGMHATVLNGVVVGAGSIIGAGALLTQGMEVPAGSLVLGSPGRVVRPVTDAERQNIADNAAVYVRLAEQHARAEPLV
jgi:carbonic anhydrase/acetyltransferase-like protein (isoleucine patch superfamily)